MSINDCAGIKLREIILNTRKPLVIRNFKNTWKCFEGTLEDWCRHYDECVEELLTFERMPLQHWDAPQWERHRENVNMSCNNFLKGCKTTEDHWLGLNYKNAQEIPLACKNGVDFDCFGFSHVTQDATFWLSSKGANTPCHYDTYGCNIVMQVYGRKSWLLFPPNTQLTPTRIPYEESSVYCLENFYSPKFVNGTHSLQAFENKSYHCILEPNDVLIVPRHWWHYVESLETSLSVNAWIPLNQDADAQIEECIVKFIMEHLALQENNDTQKYMLNPNQLNKILDDTELFAILEHLINTKQPVVPSKISDKKFAYQYLDKAAFTELLTNYAAASEVQKLTSTHFNEILTANAKRFDEKLNCSFESTISHVKEIVINSICCPAVIQLIKEKLCQRLKVNSKTW